MSEDRLALRGAMSAHIVASFLARCFLFGGIAWGLYLGPHMLLVGALGWALFRWAMPAYIER